MELQNIKNLQFKRGNVKGSKGLRIMTKRENEVALIWERCLIEGGKLWANTCMPEQKKNIYLNLYLKKKGNNGKKIAATSTPCYLPRKTVTKLGSERSLKRETKSGQLTSEVSDFIVSKLKYFSKSKKGGLQVEQKNDHTGDSSGCNVELCKSSHLLLWWSWTVFSSNPPYI